MRIVHCIILMIVALAATAPLRAQVSPHVTSDQAARLQVPQPAVDVSSPATATAAFDPQVARVGQCVYYRVAIDGAGENIQWPDVISAPPQLKFGPASKGRLIQFLANKFRPLASFLCEVRPSAVGQYTIPAFEVLVDGKRVQIPSATLNVDNSASVAPARRLVMETSATNVYVGQPLRASVMLPASPANQIEALREVEFNGGGFLSDLTTMREAVKMIQLNGSTVPAFVYEITLTPIKTGPLALSAQAFAAGHEFFGPVTISGHVVIPGGAPQYEFLTSDPVQVNVRPLPTAEQPADFGGSIGTFSLSPPQLSTNRIQQGQPVRLTVIVRSSDSLDRPVPPTPPTVNDWEIIPDNPPDFSFTLIPLTDATRQTPAIPFSCFNPTNGTYVDLTIPSVPVAVISAGLPIEMPAVDAGLTPGSPLRLGELSPSPGGSIASLVPPQLRGGLLCLQIVPILGILGLWQWDRHRRYLEAHPDIVRRREARSQLRRERRRLRDAARRGDATAIVRHAANAMKIASAPQYAAHPQALVCSDVLNQLHDADRNGAAGETVRKIFAAADARFASIPKMQDDWPALESGVDTVLLKLEEQL